MINYLLSLLEIFNFYYIISNVLPYIQVFLLLLISFFFDESFNILLDFSFYLSLLEVISFFFRPWYVVKLRQPATVYPS